MRDFLKDVLSGAIITLSLMLGLIAVGFLFTHVVALRMIMDKEMGWNVFLVLTPATLVFGGLSCAFYKAAYGIY